MTAVLKNFSFDILDYIVDEYNNTFYKTIEIKLIHVKPDSYAGYNIDSHEKDPKFKISDHVGISKYKSIFAKGYTPNWSAEVSVISKIREVVPWTYFISDLNSKKTAGTFYEKYLQETHQGKFRIEKVIKRTRNKPYIKWKGYTN